MFPLIIRNIIYYTYLSILNFNTLNLHSNVFSININVTSLDIKFMPRIFNILKC